MTYLLGTFVLSLISTLFLVKSHRFHGRYTSDSDFLGTQKFHTQLVPRVGGIALFFAMLGTCVIAAYRDGDEIQGLILLLVASLPVFFGGLAEDISKKVRVRVRLGLALASGALAYALLGAAVTRLDIIGIDWLLQFTVISFTVSIFAIAGSANAINIIDGYNGLASVVSAMIFAGLAYVSFYLGDRLLLVASVGMIGAICGFLLLNYPKGLIFLGDGGAYFIGFMICTISVLMLARHPEVSPWFPLLLCIYPVFETLFSIYRKKLLRGKSPGVPDGVHLHMLVYKRLVRWAVGSDEARLITQRNAMTSPYLWVLSSMGTIPAVLFWQYPHVLMVFVFLFAVSYVVLYRRLVLFRMPKWLVLQKKKRNS
ncbi:MraY family glycosyltransferase [Zwartia vadi]|uniref:MraY family glycosyltransferase n=1 Tax=Zwartia vadi TaxID=3058168 RepID=UPI0025B56868|nr:glycosyltransferase [Zwartia vadi]MDN3988215.1 glycosyltransferase [Zwartia vadi]